MAELAQHIRTADWQQEKHVPVIECPEKIKAGEFFNVKVTLGKAVAHPNTTEHHIRWISLYFHPEGEQTVYQVAHFDFTAHGESAEGPNKGPVYTHHEGAAQMKTAKAGSLHAMALCNIHGLWQSNRNVALA
jgi:superoxide reductase